MLTWLNSLCAEGKVVCVFCVYKAVAFPHQRHQELRSILRASGSKHRNNTALVSSKENWNKQANAHKTAITDNPGVSFVQIMCLSYGQTQPRALLVFCVLVFQTCLEISGTTTAKMQSLSPKSVNITRVRPDWRCWYKYAETCKWLLVLVTPQCIEDRKREKIDNKSIIQQTVFFSAQYVRDHSRCRQNHYSVTAFQWAQRQPCEQHWAQDTTKEKVG